MKPIPIFVTLLACTALSSPSAQAQETTELPELSSLLALFSAHALPSGGVRLNWTLEQQSPTIVSFRLYRGYEDVGNFAIMSEIPVHASGQVLDYSLTDTSARADVSYYYKVSAMGQSQESVFPVVISATPHHAGGNSSNAENLPVMILPGDKISLYVRHSGHVRLDILSQSRKPLVDDSLRPGIYEFEAPAAAPSLTLRLRHENGYVAEVTWPVH